MVPFEEREGMEGEHTPETDITRHCQVLEGGDKFESASLRLVRCFLDLLRVDSLLLQTIWKTLRLPLIRFAIQEEKASCFRATASPLDSVYHGRDDR